MMWFIIIGFIIGGVVMLKRGQHKELLYGLILLLVLLLISYTNDYHHLIPSPYGS